MGLAVSDTDAIDQLVYVYPVYGWGWVNNHDAPDPPKPFHARISSIFSYHDEQRGCTAIVEENLHEFKGLFVCFSTRHEGTYDFHNRIGAYNVSLTPTGFKTGEEGWPIAIDTHRVISGFANIGFEDAVIRYNKETYRE